MKKQLDEKTIANELSGASRFFEGSGKVKKKGRSENPNGRAVKPNGQTERSGRSVTPSKKDAAPTIATELTEGVADSNARPTERYAFEVYTDQRRRINDVQARYQIETGRKLSASRIIREALDEYLEKLETQLNQL